MKTNTIHTWEGMKHTIDWTAFATAIGYTFGWIVNHFLGILSGIWLTMQIYSWVKNKKWKGDNKSPKREVK